MSNSLSLVTSHWTKEGSRAAAAFYCMILARTCLWLVLASPEELWTSNGLKEKHSPVSYSKEPVSHGFSPSASDQ